MSDKHRGVLEHFAVLLREAGPAPKDPEQMDEFETGRRMGLHEAASWLQECLDLYGVSREEIGAEWLDGKSFLP